jgi:hypothetical protein
MQAKIVQCHYFVCRFFSDFDTFQIEVLSPAAEIIPGWNW